MGPTRVLILRIFPTCTFIQYFKVSLLNFISEYIAVTEVPNFIEDEKSSQKLLKKEYSKRNQNEILLTTEGSEKTPQKQDLNRFEFFHKPNENIFGFSSSLHDSGDSIPATFSYEAPTNTDEKLVNIRLKIEKSNNDYKVHVENLASDLESEEILILNNENPSTEKVITVNSQENI